MPLHVYTMKDLCAVCRRRRSLFDHWHQLVLHHMWTVKGSSERDGHNGSSVSRVLWSWADDLVCHYEYYCFV